MPNQPFKVFISSTIVDLHEYRRQIIEVLNEPLFIPLVQEYMGSYSEDPVTVCEEYVKACDIFIGIYAFRYGFVPGEDKNTLPSSPSITELEFNAARRYRKRCVCYFADDRLREDLKSDDGPLAVEKQQRLEQFKQNIRTSLVCAKPFHSPDRLRADVSRDLSYCKNNGPLGYSRNDVLNWWPRWDDELLGNPVGDWKREHRSLIPHLNIIQSPLQEYWDNEFINEDGWHEHIGGKLINLAEAVSHFSEFDALRDDIEKILGEKRDYESLLEMVCELTRKSYFKEIKNVLSRKKVLPEIQHDAKQDIYKIMDWILDEIHQIRFRRCFLVVGETGSGKSHFAASIMANNPNQESIDSTVDNKLVLPLPISFDQVVTTDKKLSIEKIILSSINTALRMQWRSIDEFDRLLSGCSKAREYYGPSIGGDEHAPNMEGNIRTGRLRIIVILDDIPNDLLSSKDFIETLTSCIAKSTVFPCLYWYIAITDVDFDLVSRNLSKLSIDKNRPLVDIENKGLTRPHRSFWHRYGIFFPEFVESLDRNMCPRKSDDTRIQIGGWLILHHLNTENNIGLNIIKHVSDNCIQIDQMRLNIKNYSTETAISLWCNPFIAWIFCDIQQSQRRLPNLPDLCYIDFINVFIAQSLERISEKYDIEDLKDTIAFIADAILKLNNPFPDEVKLIAQVINIAKDFKTWGDNDIRIFIDSLIDIGLLKQEKLINPTNRGIKLKHIRLYPELFWGHALARQIKELDDFRSKNYGKAAFKLQQLFTIENNLEISHLGLSEDSIQFLFLLYIAVDQPAQSDEARFIEKLANFMITSKNMPVSAVWRAGAKARKNFQHFLCDQLMIRNKRFRNSHELFTWALFIENVSTDVISMAERLCLIQPHFPEFKEGDRGLADFVRLFVECKFALTKNNEEILKCMKYLHGCEVLEIAPVLAGVTISTLFANASYKKYELLALLLRFAEHEHEQAEKDYSEQQRKKTGEHWNRSFYRQWVFCTFCHVLTSRHHPSEVYWFLEDNGWYRQKPSSSKKKYKGNKMITIEMEREANIALGSWWYMHYREKIGEVRYAKQLIRSQNKEERHEGYILLNQIKRPEGDLGKQFIDLVFGLANSKSSSAREHAFYIILHTNRTKGKANVHIDPEFRPILRTILLDQSNQWIGKKFVDLFRLNLEDFHEIAPPWVFSVRKQRHKGFH